MENIYWKKLDMLNNRCILAIRFITEVIMTATLGRAKNIASTIGMRSAGGYLRRRGVPIEIALYWLIGTSAYHRFVDHASN